MSDRARVQSVVVSSVYCLQVSNLCDVNVGVTLSGWRRRDRENRKKKFMNTEMEKGGRQGDQRAAGRAEGGGGGKVTFCQRTEVRYETDRRRQPTHASSIRSTPAADAGVGRFVRLYNRSALSRFLKTKCVSSLVEPPLFQKAPPCAISQHLIVYEFTANDGVPQGRRGSIQLHPRGPRLHHNGAR